MYIHVAIKLSALFNSLSRMGNSQLPSNSTSSTAKISEFCFSYYVFPVVAYALLLILAIFEYKVLLLKVIIAIMFGLSRMHQN